MKTRKDPKRTYGGVRAGQRVRERREKLLAAGLEAFGTTGYAGASIKEICGLAGLTERYFYESFQNKEELLRCVYNNVIDVLVEKAMAELEQPGLTPLEMVLRPLRVHYESLRQDPRKARMLFFEVLGVSPAIDQTYQDGTRRFMEIISHVACKAYPVMDKAQLEASIVPTGLAGALDLMAMKWVLDGFEPPLDDIMAQIQFLVESFEHVLPFLRSGEIT